RPQKRSAICQGTRILPFTSNLFPLSPFIRPQQTLLMNKKRALSERFFFQKVPSTIHIVGVVLLTTNHHSS
ncbi:MAG: hypothetical protein ACLTUC_29425, partial [Anaerobutyricum soehngenii]